VGGFFSEHGAVVYSMVVVVVVVVVTVDVDHDHDSGRHRRSSSSSSSSIVVATTTATLMLLLQPCGDGKYIFNFGCQQHGYYKQAIGCQVEEPTVSSTDAPVNH